MTDSKVEPAGPTAARQPASGRFWMLWGAASVSLIGTQVTLVALPLVAVQHLNASSFMMGLLAAVGWLPVALLGLFVGAYVDRGQPVRIMTAANLARLVLISLIPLAHFAGMLNVGILLVVAFVAGIGAVFFDVAYQTYLPQTVPAEGLATANSRLELSRSVAQLLGPAAAGLLVAALSAPTALLIDAAGFGVSLLLLVRLWLPRAKQPSVKRDNPALLASVREGIAFIRTNAAIKAVIVAASASNLFISGAMALQVLLAITLLDMSPQQLGVALAAEGVAALAAAAAAPWLSRRIGDGGVVLASFCLMALGSALLFVAPTYVGVAMFAGAQLCFGLSGPLINITLVTMRQRLTPPELLGRVNAAARVAIMCTLPIGAVGFGALASGIGLRQTFLVIAVGLLVVAVHSHRRMRMITTTPLSSAAGCHATRRPSTAISRLSVDAWSGCRTPVVEVGHTGFGRRPPPSADSPTGAAMQARSIISAVTVFTVTLTVALLPAGPAAADTALDSCYDSAAPQHQDPRLVRAGEPAEAMGVAHRHHRRGRLPGAGPGSRPDRSVGHHQEHRRRCFRPRLRRTSRSRRVADQAGQMVFHRWSLVKQATRCRLSRASSVS